MNRHFLSLGLATLSLIAAPLAFAQDAPPVQDPTTTAAEPEEAGKITWSELDADGDGALSKTEAAPVTELSMAFDSADTDKNGTLTSDEYKAYKSGAQETPAPTQR
ncbi:MAG: EF-hand domain-containing protein [Pseudomonadota bacterium]|nr:EF-hand domain-containing protein [Pseudomonadota bacterium]